MGQIGHYILDVLIATGMQLLVLFFPMIFLAFMMNFISKGVEIKLSRLLGLKLFLFLFGWLGTIIHESGHALFCLIFKHKIEEIKFFSPDAETGTLGYVKHSYNPKSIYQTVGNFFIGIGPILLGVFVIYLSTYILLGHFIALTPPNSKEQVTLVNQLLAMVKQLFNKETILNFRLYIFLYIALSVGSAINLSPPDLKGATKGFAVILLLMFTINLATAWFGKLNYNSVLHNQFFLLFYLIMGLSIIINFIMVLIIPPFLKLR